MPYCQRTVKKGRREARLPSPPGIRAGPSETGKRCWPGPSLLTYGLLLEKRLLGDLQMTSLEMLVFIPAAIGGVLIAMVVLYDLLK